MSELKIRLSQVPSRYHSQMFNNLIARRGIEGSRGAIVDDITLSQAFPWLFTPEGHEFWQAISEGGSPGVTVTSTTASSELEELVKEAESRGFANGVSTKWGVIKDEFEPGYGIQPHELLPDGTFYYRNIKVRNAKGKWIKPSEQPKKGYKVITGGDQLPDAIHELISGIMSKLGRN
jgi:hypothetical protein